MKRFAGMISLIAIFGLGSAFAAVCALACQAPAPMAAEASVSHCHQSSEKELPGPGFRKARQACPVLAALKSQPNFHAPAAPAPVAKAQLGWQLLPLETVALLQRKPRLFFLAEASPPSPLPLYLKKQVLRL